MDEKQLTFLLEAKRHTYAAKGAEAASSRPASHDLHWQEGDLTYIDSFLGGRQFVGEEGLWEAGQPVWSMNYMGRVTAEAFSGDFLKAALMRVPREAPYRGPFAYREGNMTYTMEVQGDTDWFQGREWICLGEQQVYECCFHGGAID